jgi:hypothetical protein
VKSKLLLSGLLAGICLCFVRIISNEFLTHAAEGEVCPDQDPTFGVRDMSAELKFHQVLWLVPNVTQGDHCQLVPPFAHPRQAGFCIGKQSMMQHKFRGKFYCKMFGQCNHMLLCDPADEALIGNGWAEF